MSSQSHYQIGGFTWQVLQEQSLERHADGQNTAPDWTLFCLVDCSSSNLQQGSASSRLRLQVGSMTSSAWLIICCWSVTTKLKKILIKTWQLLVITYYWSVFINVKVRTECPRITAKQEVIKLFLNSLMFGLNCFNHLLFRIFSQHLLSPW